MKGNKITENRAVWIAGFTFLTALIWITLTSYHELVRKDRVEGVEQLLTPINPELDEEILQEISNRKEYQIDEVEEFIKAEPTLVPTSKPTPTGIVQEVETETEETGLEEASPSVEQSNQLSLEEEND